jgi:hypothetical protein
VAAAALLLADFFAIAIGSLENTCRQSRPSTRFLMLHCGMPQYRADRAFCKSRAVASSTFRLQRSMYKSYRQIQNCPRDSSQSLNEFEQSLGKSWTSLLEFLNLPVFGL